jgi:vacuolar-type H+-ATPase subunit D/Vma8
MLLPKEEHLEQLGFFKSIKDEMRRLYFEIDSKKNRINVLEN